MQYKEIKEKTQQEIRDTSIYKELKTGRVYRLTDNKGKQTYVLYSRPDYSSSNYIYAYPLTKNLEAYKGKRGYSQHYWLNWYVSIEEIEDNMKREDNSTYVDVYNGNEKIRVYK